MQCISLMQPMLNAHHDCSLQSCIFEKAVTTTQLSSALLYAGTRTDLPSADCNLLSLHWGFKRGKNHGPLTHLENQTHYYFLVSHQNNKVNNTRLPQWFTGCWSCRDCKEEQRVPEHLATLHENVTRFPLILAKRGDGLIVLLRAGGCS